MSIKPEQTMDLAEAEQDFGRSTQIADKFGAAYICIDDRPKYILIDVESGYNIEMTNDEKIDFVAARILKKYHRAFEELGKSV